MITFTHVYKTYPGPVHALRDISFEIAKGEFVFLTGASGAGKTTLFKMVSAFDQVTSGQVQVAGQFLNDLSPKEIPYFRRKIGVVFQDFKLLKDRSVFENVALPLMILGHRPSQIQRRVNEVLDQVGLIHRSHHYPEFLSGGEQQRTAIARSIVHHPGVLIADEPTGNLDPNLSEEIMDLFERVCAQGTSVFVASHNHEMLKRRNHRILNLNQGTITEHSSINYPKEKTSLFGGISS